MDHAAHALTGAVAQARMQYASVLVRTPAPELAPSALARTKSTAVLPVASISLQIVRAVVGVAPHDDVSGIDMAKARVPFVVLRGADAIAGRERDRRNQEKRYDKHRHRLSHGRQYR